MPPSLYRRSLLEAFAAGEHEAFVAAGGRPLRPRLARALALADLRPGLRIVDIGCGRGEATLHCARRGARVTAVDFSRDSLDMTEQTLRLSYPDESVRRRVRCLQSDASRIPVADQSADRVLLLDVAEHLHDWQLHECLCEVRRILRPGGFVVVHTLPNKLALAVSYPLLRLFGPELPSRARSEYERAVHVNEQDPRSLAEALRKAGLGARVWVEEWSTRHAARAIARDFPDGARSRGYSVLRRPHIRILANLAMTTPLASCVGNDIFAIGWRGSDAPPSSRPRWRAVRWAVFGAGGGRPQSRGVLTRATSASTIHGPRNG